MNHIDPESLTKISGPASRIEHFLPSYCLSTPATLNTGEGEVGGGLLNLRNFPHRAITFVSYCRNV